MRRWRKCQLTARADVSTDGARNAGLATRMRERIMRAHIGTTIASVLIAFTFVPVALAQDDPHAACAAMGWVPREILERPVSLRAGTGNSLDVATTSSGDAQAFYRQGM